MPRPLILKVEDHKPQPGRRIMGSIDFEVLKARDPPCSLENGSAADEARELGSRSLVRSLISRYESAVAKESLSKYKSKSMVDLRRPLPVNVARKTQDDALYNRPGYKSENEKFNFKRVLSVFEDTSQVDHRSKPPGSPSNAADVQQKACKLLESYNRGQRDSAWLDQVIEVLQQISNRDLTGSNRTVQENEAASAPQPEIEIKPKKTEEANGSSLGPATPKVKDMKSFFEVNGGNDGFSPLQQNGQTHVSTDKIKKYFTGDHSDEKREEGGSEELGNKETEFDGPNLSDDPQESSELRHFEMAGDRMLPLSNIYILDSQDVEQETLNASSRQIEKLVEELGQYEEKVRDFSKECENEAEGINNSLITILIKLDDVTSYSNQTLLAKKKRAIQSVQECISMLNEKVKEGKEEQTK